MKKFFIIALVAIFAALNAVSAKSIVVNHKSYNLSGYIYENEAAQNLSSAKTIIPVYLYPNDYKPNNVDDGDWTLVIELENGNIFVCSAWAKPPQGVIINKDRTVTRLSPAEIKKLSQTKAKKLFDYAEKNCGYCYATDKNGTPVVLVYKN